MTFEIKQQRELHHSIEGELYGSKKFYISGYIGDNANAHYMRNDGKLFESMQTSPIDLNGGTYFLTQQEAQECLDRYNAAKDDQNKDTETTTS